MMQVVKLSEERISIDHRKVVMPSQLELDLERDDNCNPPFLITLGGVVIDQFSDENKARATYAKMQEAVNCGDYSLVFNNSLKPRIKY